MARQIKMVAKTLVSYGGASYGANMEFMADAADAERFEKTGEAVRASEAKDDPDLKEIKQGAKA